MWLHVFSLISWKVNTLQNNAVRSVTCAHHIEEGGKTPAKLPNGDVSWNPENTNEGRCHGGNVVRQGFTVCISMEKETVLSVDR